MKERGSSPINPEARAALKKAVDTPALESGQELSPESLLPVGSPNEPANENGRPKNNSRRVRGKGGKKSSKDTIGNPEVVPANADDANSLDSETPLEMKKKLAALVQAVPSSGSKAGLKKLSDTLSSYHSPEKVSAASLREARAEKLAAETGLTAVRSALLDTEAKYREAFKLKKLGKQPDNFKQIELEYENATLEWSNSLSSVANERGGTAQTNDEAGTRLYYEALVIRKRDTILRKGQIENEARTEALDERGRTAYGKVLNWAAATPKVLLNLYNLPFNLAGEAAVAGVSAIDKLIPRKEKSRIQNLSPLQKKAMVQRYARGAKIVAGAALGTAISIGGAPVTAAAGLTFALLAGRGALGLAAGIAGGKIGGSVYEKYFGSKERLSARQAVRTTSANTLESLRKQQKVAQSGSRGERLKKRQWWQMGGALLGGGAVGFASAPLAHAANDLFSDLPSVKDAEAVLTSGSVRPEVGMRSHVIDNTVAPYSSGSESIPAAHSFSATIEPGQGADHLFSKLQQSLEVQKLPVEMQELLSKHPNVLSRKFGLAWGDATDGSQSLKMQPGDTLEYDSATNTLKLIQGDKTHILAQANEQGGLDTKALTHTEPESVAPPQRIETVPASHVAEAPTAPQEVIASEVKIAPESNVQVTDAPVPANDYSGYSNLSDGVPQRNLAPDVIQSKGPFGNTNMGSNDYVRLDELKEKLSPTSEALTVNVNSFGVDVDPKVPAVYEWKMPGTENKLIVASGGTPADAAEFAKEYVTKHPGTTVLFKTPPSQSLFGGGRVRIDAWVSDEDGKVSTLKEAYGPKAASMLTLDSENFTRELASK